MAPTTGENEDKDKEAASWCEMKSWKIRHLFPQETQVTKIHNFWHHIEIPNQVDLSDYATNERSLKMLEMPQQLRHENVTMPWKHALLVWTWNVLFKTSGLSFLIPKLLGLTLIVSKVLPHCHHLSLLEETPVRRPRQAHLRTSSSKITCRPPFSTIIHSFTNIIPLGYN